MNETFWRSVRKLSSVQRVSSSFDAHDTQKREALESAKPEILKILLAEDSMLQQSLISLLLKRLGHNVTVVGDGFEAVTSARIHDFDVILMDCQMPLMNGLEATRFIRSIYATSKGKQEVTIVGVSASYSPEDCFEAGMDYFLRKPLKMPILQAVLGGLKRNNRETRQTLESNLSATFSSD